jgi:REP element-mobilizing transposase RayT
MPEHFHLLMSEPDRGDPSVVMQVVKQRVTQAVNLQSDQKIAQFWPTALL